MHVCMPVSGAAHPLTHASTSLQAQQLVSTSLTSSLAHGGMVSPWVRSGTRSAEALLPILELFTLAESLGGVECLAELPAWMTHASILPAEREALGIVGLRRLSCGIEEVEELRSALDGLEDEHSGFESGFATPSDVSDDGPDVVEC
ncbi:Cys/Met metabolism PLP-dependent enzyme-domain-containing protein [Suillus lakei]|nr:Cys/Met metabolism PLP-dependent enzyme-domain-containing protein [Suillus lakei]